MERQLRIARQRTRPPAGPPPVRPVEFAPPPLPPSMAPESGVARVVGIVLAPIYRITQVLGFNADTGAVGADVTALTGVFDQPAREIISGPKGLAVGDYVMFFWARSAPSRDKTGWSLCCIGLHHDPDEAGGEPYEYSLSGLHGCNSLVFDAYGDLQGIYDCDGAWHPRIPGAAPIAATLISGVPPS